MDDGCFAFYRGRLQPYFYFGSQSYCGEGDHVVRHARDSRSIRIGPFGIADASASLTWIVSRFDMTELRSTIGFLGYSLNKRDSATGRDRYLLRLCFQKEACPTKLPCGYTLTTSETRIVPTWNMRKLYLQILNHARSLARCNLSYLNITRLPAWA